MISFRRELRCATSMTVTRRSRTAPSTESSSHPSDSSHLYVRREVLAMETLAARDAVKTITTHYIDGAFVESHGREVMDIIKPTNGEVIARVTLGDEEDTRRAIAAAKRAFVTFGRTTKEERAGYLRRLHEAVSERI